jgi:DNA-binding MurR/RpiR family transcriptional regulator
MKIDILKHISSVSHTLPKNQQLVSRYLMDNWERALYESSLMIARKVGVSQSTVVRTVANLGYDSYPEFQAALRLILQDQISSINRIDQVSTEQKGQSLEQRIKKMFDQHQENLKTTLVHLDTEQLLKAARLIWKGKRIYILGLRTSGSLAHYFGLPLSMIRENVTILSSDYALIENIRTTGSGDVLIAFSFTRYYQDTIAAASLARERGCTIIGITDTIAAPLTRLGDIVFHVPVISMHYSNSYAAVVALIDILLNTIGTDNKIAVMKALKDMEEGFKKFHIFGDK